MKRQRVLAATRASLGIGALLALAGCGGTLYAVQAGDASSKLQEAQQLDAEHRAVYEYTLAREHFAEAQQQAAQGEYGDAVELMQSAEQHAQKAIDQARGVPSGATP